MTRTSGSKRLLALILSVLMIFAFIPVFGGVSSVNAEGNIIDDASGVTSFSFTPVEKTLEVSSYEIQYNYYDPGSEFEGSSVTIKDENGTKTYTFRWVDDEEPTGEGWAFYDEDDNLCPYTVRLHWCDGPIYEEDYDESGGTFQYKAVLKNNESTSEIAESTNIASVKIAPYKTTINNVVYAIEDEDLEEANVWYYKDEIKGKVEILPSVTIGGKKYSVTVIDYNAFDGATDVTNVMIPNSVTTIREYAFYNTGIKEIKIPSSVEKIDKYAIGYRWNSITEKEALVSDFIIDAKKDTTGYDYAIANGIKWVDREAEAKAKADAAARDAAAKAAAAKAAAAKAAAELNAKIATAQKVRVAPKAKSLKKRKVQISWKKKAGVSGFEVWQSAKKNKKYKKAASLKASKTKWKSKKIKRGKKAFFKVRAFTKINGKKYYGKWSKVITVKLKK